MGPGQPLPVLRGAHLRNPAEYTPRACKRASQGQEGPRARLMSQQGAGRTGGATWMVGKGRQGSGGHEVRRADGLQNQVTSRPRGE